MNLDKNTLEQTLKQLATNLTEINQGLEARANEIQRLQNEVQQHLGARAYNQILTTQLQKQLQELPPVAPA